MPNQPSNQFAPLPGHAVRDAVLEAARRKRSLRPYVIPGVLIGGLAAPIVTMGTADQLPVTIPGTDTTTTLDATLTDTPNSPTDTNPVHTNATPPNEKKRKHP